MFRLVAFCLRSPRAGNSVRLFIRSPLSNHSPAPPIKEATMRSARCIVALSLLAGLLVATAEAAVLNKTAVGKPAIKSINCLSFAPDGVLLIGDGAGSQIFAVETGDLKSAGTLAEKITAI